MMIEILVLCFALMSLFNFALLLNFYNLVNKLNDTSSSKTIKGTKDQFAVYDRVNKCFLQHNEVYEIDRTKEIKIIKYTPEQIKAAGKYPA